LSNAVRSLPTLELQDGLTARSCSPEHYRLPVSATDRSLARPHACHLSFIVMLALRQRIPPDESHNGTPCSYFASLNAVCIDCLTCVLNDIYCHHLIGGRPAASKTIVRAVKHRQACDICKVHPATLWPSVSVPVRKNKMPHETRSRSGSPSLQYNYKL